MTTTAKHITITDLQRATLEAAAAREGGYVWPLPEELGLRKGSAVLVAKALLGKGLVKERRAKAGEPVWREDEHEKPMTVAITRAGLAAVGGVGTAAAMDDDASEAQEEKSAAAPDASASGEPRSMPRAGSKLAALVELLARGEGATVEEMVAATAWQAHTVRGVMSGALVKKFGMRIVSEKVKGRGRAYRASDLSGTGSS